MHKIYSDDLGWEEVRVSEVLFRKSEYKVCIRSDKYYEE